MSKCQCGDPATRLIKVVSTNDRPLFSMEKSTRFACCEPHRHSAKEILEKEWADELATKEVKILMGRRRRAGT